MSNVESHENTTAGGPFLQLARLSTPTVYNGWEQITARDAGRECFNLEEVRDFMPELGPLVGRAVTVVIEPGNPGHRQSNPTAWQDYRAYVAGVPGPKVVVVQDLDKPRTLGAFWGEVNSSIHKALGCLGTIIDGGVRDVEEMTRVGFKVLARRLCVGHAHSTPVRWNVPVEIFGVTIEPGQLIHADRHGFLAIPCEDEDKVLEAARFMDDNECRTMIAAARGGQGKSAEQICAEFNAAAAQFARNAQSRFARKGERTGRTS
jgi:regulator of RNase E activity RraA